EQHHLGAAQIGRARWHALPALGAGGDELDHVLIVDHRVVNSGGQLADSYQTRLREWAGQQAIVATNTRHGLLGYFAVELASVVAHTSSSNRKITAEPSSRSSPALSRANSLPSGVPERKLRD